MQPQKADGTTVHVDIHPSNVDIARLKLEKDCKKDSWTESQFYQVGKEMGKYKKETIEKIQEQSNPIYSFHYKLLK